MSLWRRIRAMGLWHELVLVGLLAGLLAGAWYFEQTRGAEFVSWETQTALSSHVWEMALLSIPLTLIIITGGIDLSVGAIMSLSAVTMGLAWQAGLGVWPAVGLTLAVGLTAGALNGAFVVFLGVHPLIVTLGTMSAYRGIAEGLIGAEPVSGFPLEFLALSEPLVAGLPPAGVLFVVLAVAAGVLLGRTAAGRELRAIGYNETAARFSGVAVARTKLLLYTASGLVAASAAVLFVARRDTAKADVGAGLELTAITAVVLGGTSIFGGRGRIGGTVLGVLLLHEVRSLVAWRWNRDELTFIIVGALLILSVLVHSVLTRRKS